MSDAQFEQAQRRLQALDRHLAALERDADEIQRALATLGGLEGDADLETLVPIGGGVQLPARVDPATKVMLHLGAGYTTQTDVGTAKDRLRGRLERTQAALRSTSQEAEQVAMAMQQMQLDSS